MSLFNDIKGRRSHAENEPANGIMSVDEVMAHLNGNGADSLHQSTTAPTHFTRKDRGKGMSDNLLRPEKLSEFVGQDEAKLKLRKHIDAAFANKEPLLHVLLGAKAGQGKTTLANLIAAELGTTAHVVQCPVHSDTLAAMASGMHDGDVLVLDEVHLQAKSKAAQAGPEVLYHIMEDGRLYTHQGQMLFPDVTVVGATTDVGQLPSSFTERFPLKVHLRNYTVDELTDIAKYNAKQIGSRISDDAARTLAGAALGTPREVNNMVKQASSIARSLRMDEIDGALALDVLKDDGREIDGLTTTMMDYLRGLWERRRYSHKNEEWIIKASLETMAHVVGRARDKTFIAHEVEPTLIARGFIVIEGGRVLTEKGMKRLGVKLEAPPVKGA